MSLRRLIAFCVVLFAAGSCTTFQPPPSGEFRGVWIATVRNVDWPSKPGLPVEQQKRELIAIFDKMVALGLNGAILQVRPSADALYDSKLEPWSEYLTGTMGQAPEPYYDPLAFAVAEAHKRGLELHAWLNPYRARRFTETTPAAPTHITRANPEVVRSYGSFLWMDPGEPLVRERTVAVIRDIVHRYGVDGIHFDDYFYPYPENGLDFPDDATYRRYGGGLTKDEWRRKNVDDLIQQVSEAIRQERPEVKFGVSPFGIWRPKNPRNVRGFDAYASIYADARKWFRLGWVDYLSPQLYWSSAAPQQPFPDLLRWWSQQNRHGRHLWPGLAAYRIGRKNNNGAPVDAEEIVRQIRRIRSTGSGNGWILFSAKVLMENRGGISDRLAQLNREAAPLPQSEWMGTR